MSEKLKHQGKIYFITVSLCIFIYVIARAYLLSFTHDESLSFTIVSGDNTYRDTANNHYLNTWLMWLSSMLFGNGEFALRLPNVLAFIPYSIGCYLILKEAKVFWMFILGTLICFFNPFLLEFFSLARGYGLSIGFLMMGVYHLTKSESTKEENFIGDFSYCILFSSLAVLANLAMINFFISVVVIFVFKYLKSDSGFKIKNRKAFVKVIIVSFGLLGLGMYRLSQLSAKNELYFGAETFNSGLDTYFIQFMYLEVFPDGLHSIIKSMLIMFLLGGVLLLLFNRDSESKFFRIKFLILLWLAGLFLEGLLFDAKYPLGRTAMFYFPLLGIYLFLLFDTLIDRNKWNKPILTIVFGMLITPVAYNFYLGLNLNRTVTWGYDANTKEVMMIIEENSKSRSEPVKISNNWLFEPSMNYYITTRKINAIPADRNGVSIHSDFIYYLNVDKSNEYEGFESFFLEKWFDDSHSGLFVKENGLTN